MNTYLCMRTVLDLSVAVCTLLNMKKSCPNTPSGSIVFSHPVLSSIPVSLFLFILTSHILMSFLSYWCCQDPVSWTLFQWFLFSILISFGSSQISSFFFFPAELNLHCFYFPMLFDSICILSVISVPGSVARIWHRCSVPDKVSYLQPLIRNSTVILYPISDLLVHVSFFPVPA